jgi:hypothetical protein
MPRHESARIVLFRDLPSTMLVPFNFWFLRKHQKRRYSRRLYKRPHYVTVGVRASSGAPGTRMTTAPRALGIDGEPPLTGLQNLTQGNGFRMLQLLRSSAALLPPAKKARPAAHFGNSNFKFTSLLSAWESVASRCSVFLFEKIAEYQHPERSGRILDRIGSLSQKRTEAGSPRRRR